MSAGIYPIQKVYPFAPHFLSTSTTSKTATAASMKARSFHWLASPSPSPSSLVARRTLFVIPAKGLPAFSLYYYGAATTTVTTLSAV